MSGESYRYITRLTAACLGAAAILLAACGDAPSPTGPAEPQTASADTALVWDWELTGLGTGTGGGDEGGLDGCKGSACNGGCSLSNPYAPPLAWGEYAWAGEHTGPRTYTVYGSPVSGNTILTGEVKYWNGEWIEQQFAGSITFTVGNAVAVVYTRYYGNPYGTGVNQKVC